MSQDALFFIERTQIQDRKEIRRKTEFHTCNVLQGHAFKRHRFKLVIVIVILGIYTYYNIFADFTHRSLLNTFKGTTLIDRPLFKYIRTPKNICSLSKRSEDPDLLIIVKSDVTHFSYRMAIRLTWGNFSLNNLKVVFLLGYSFTIDTLVNAEYERFQDIVQEDFIDAYRNNTYKTIMGFNWAVNFCPRTRFLLFVDDDYFVNVKAIQKYIKANGNSTRYLAAGYRIDNARADRRKESRWYVSKTEYPFWHYPPYLSGGAMLLSMSTANLFNTEFNYVRQIYIDDVYIGIVAYLLQIDFLHDERFVLSFEEDSLVTCLAAHNYGSPDYLIQIWKDFLKNQNDRTLGIYRHQIIDILETI